jgi:RHS repeat-associated protein
MTYGAGAGPHALTGFKGRQIKYDASDRMIDDGERSFGWDAADHLVSVKSARGDVVDSTFDSLGARRSRVERSASGEVHTARFIDPWAEVRDGQLVRFIVHGGSRIAKLSPTNGVPQAKTGGCSVGDRRAAVDGSVLLSLFPVLLVTLFRNRGRGRLPRFRSLAQLLAALICFGCGAHADNGPPPILDGTIQVLDGSDALLFYDAIGTLTEQTNGLGEGTASFAAYPFGGVRYDTSSETDKYAGTPHDGTVGIERMGVRAYLPELGVWTSPDPLAGSDPARLVGASFASNNPFAYAGLNPISRTDRGGLLDDPMGKFIEVAAQHPVETAAAVSTVATVVSRIHPVVVLALVAVAVPVVVIATSDVKHQPTSPTAPAPRVQSPQQQAPPPQAHPDPKPSTQGAGSGVKKPNNPDGCNGKPDHQATVNGLVERAKQERVNIAASRGQPTTDFEIWENRSIKGKTGVDRRPDVAIYNSVTDKIEKVYEAARLKPPTQADPSRCEFVTREEAKMDEYDKAQIPSHFEPVTP